MAKRRKTKDHSSPSVPSAPIAGHPPVKRPALLIVGIVLFVLWFLFMLATAISGLLRASARASYNPTRNASAQFLGETWIDTSRF